MPLEPAVDKLPIAVRKDIRDKWESKKPEIEGKISALLGEAWKLEADFNLIYANVSDKDYKSRLGEVTMWYMEPLAANIKKYVDQYGDDGKSELNSICSAHTVKFGPQDETTFGYGGLYVKDGTLQLVYNLKSFASNVNDVSKDIAPALKKASESSGSASAYNLVARNGVRDKYDGPIKDVQKKIGALVGVPDIKLNGNFENNATELKKAGSKVRDDWDRIMGAATFEYFNELLSQLNRDKFDKDDMLQEGFQEAVDKNEITVKVVDKLEHGSYNDLVIRNGVLYIEMLPQTWWSNVSGCASRLVQIL